MRSTLGGIVRSNRDCLLAFTIATTLENAGPESTIGIPDTTRAPQTPRVNHHRWSTPCIYTYELSNAVPSPIGMESVWVNYSETEPITSVRSHRVERRRLVTRSAAYSIPTIKGMQAMTSGNTSNQSPSLSPRGATHASARTSGSMKRVVPRQRPTPSLKTTTEPMIATERVKGFETTGLVTHV